MCTLQRGDFILWGGLTKQAKDTFLTLQCIHMNCQNICLADQKTLRFLSFIERRCIDLIPWFLTEMDHLYADSSYGQETSRANLLIFSWEELLLLILNLWTHIPHIISAVVMVVFCSLRSLSWWQEDINFFLIDSMNIEVSCWYLRHWCHMNRFFFLVLAFIVHITTCVLFLSLKRWCGSSFQAHIAH